MKLLQSLKTKLCDWLKPFADKHLSEENDALVTSLNQSVGLLNLKDDQIAGLVESVGELQQSRSIERNMLEDIAITLLLHCGGQAIVSREICESVETSQNTIEILEVNEGYQFSIVPIPQGGEDE